jgi:phenylacetate-CoA ligase
VWAQHQAVTAYGLYRSWLRFGGGYPRYVEEYLEREHFSEQDWDAWQRRRLTALLRVSATTVPYYQRVWTATEKAAASAGRLEELPLLDKDAVRRDPQTFLRVDLRPWPRLVYHTSGSTGTPIASIWTVREVRYARALREARSARWAAVSFRMPRGTISGRLVEPNPDSIGPHYRFNAAEQQVYFSAFHLRPDTAAGYVQALWRHGIQWMTGYTVSFSVLARFILDQRLAVPPLRAIITTSEKLTPEMRRVIETAFRCRVYEEYSTVENAIFASECESGRLHVSPDAGLLEILRPDGSRCAPGEVGEVVATCLSRAYQPFIRYRLGDLAAWDPEPCPCGRKMPVLAEVVGRMEDVVTGPDGRQLVRFHGVFVDQPHVREGQIVQESVRRIRIRVVPVDGFGPTDVRSLVQRVQDRLGPQVEVAVEVVDRIPRMPSGKFQAVVSLVKADGRA